MYAYVHVGKRIYTLFIRHAMLSKIMRKGVEFFIYSSALPKTTLLVFTTDVNIFLLYLGIPYVF